MALSKRIGDYMKPRIIIFLLVALLAAPLIPAPLHALENDDLDLIFKWSAETYYPGDYGNLSISLESKNTNALKFDAVRLVFIGGYYYFHDFLLDLRRNPITIPPEGFCTFPNIEFYFHSRDPTGPMQFSVFLQLEENGTSGWSATTWVSQSYSIMVRDTNERVYRNATREIEERLAQAQVANFTDSNAKSLLLQSLGEKDLAAELAQERKWREAVTHAETAADLLEQAFSSEKLYWNGQASAALSSLGLRLNQTKLQSSEARTLLSQASVEADGAQKAYNSEDYKNATLLAFSATNLLEKALEAERIAGTQGWQTTVLVASGMVVVAVASVAFILVRRKNKKL